MACKAIRDEFNFPVLGVILPGARAAVRYGKRIGVISTPATAASNAYRNAIQEISPNAEVWQVGCPKFVPLIEQNRIYDPHTKEVARQYLNPLLEKNIDTLVYGCTHYRHLKPVFQEILPATVQLIESRQLCGESGPKRTRNFRINQFNHDPTDSVWGEWLSRNFHPTVSTMARIFAEC